MMNRDERLLFGHLWAVGAASLALLICLGGKGFVEQFEALSLQAFFGALFIGLLFVPFVWWLFAVFTWMTATIPIVICFVISEKFSIRNVWYYLACGALTGIVGTPLYASRGGTLRIPAFDEQWITDAPLIVSCGAFGGLVYWWKAGRWAGAVPTNSDAGNLQ